MAKPCVPGWATDIRGRRPPWARGAWTPRHALVLLLASALAGCSPEQDAASLATAKIHGPPPGPTADPEFLLRFQADYRRALGPLPFELPSPTRFQRTPQAQVQVAAQFVERYRPVYGAPSDEVLELLASGQALEALGGQIRDHGLDPDDVADIMAFHFAVHWAIANADTVPGEQLPAIRDMLEPRILEALLADGPDARSMQQVGDGYALETVARSMEYVALLRASDQRSAAAYRDAVHRDFLERTGTDLRAAPVPLPGRLR